MCKTAMIDGKQYNRQDLTKRLVGKIDVDKKTECWHWTGAKGAYRVGTMTVTSTAGAQRLVPVRKVTWALAFGHIRAGQMPKVMCGDPLCVNPGHMVLDDAGEDAGEERHEHDGLRRKVAEAQAIKESLGYEVEEML